MDTDGKVTFTEDATFGGDVRIPQGAFIASQTSTTNPVARFTNTNVNQNVLSSHTSSGFNQDNYVINWDSSSGAQYQIQSSTDLTNWVDVGSALIGTGDMMTWANHVTNSQAFYRVVED